MDQLGVVNHALTLLGVEPITTMDEATAQARAATHLWEPVLAAALSSYRWTFAREETAQLAQLVDETADGYERYQLPADFRTLTRVYTASTASGSQGATEIDFRIDGSVVVVFEDVGTGSGLFVGYVKDVDVGLCPGHFTTALAFELAAQLALSLTENNTAAELWATKAEAQWKKARRADFQISGTRFLAEANEYGIVAGRHG